MHYIWMFVVGLAAGYIARALHPGKDNIGFILTGVLGIAGSFAANFLGQAIGWYKAGEGAGFIASVVGAILLLVIYGFVAKRLTLPPPEDLGAAPTLDLGSAARRSRRLLNRRALVAAAASAVPVPGLDWAVDAALLSNLIPAINREFGLAPEQIDRLDPTRRAQVEKAVAVVGSMLIGKFITRDLVLKVAKTVGLRLTAQQAAKFVPIAGQAASALMGYLAIRAFGEMHIRDCVRARQQLQTA